MNSLSFTAIAFSGADYVSARWGRPSRWDRLFAYLGGCNFCKALFVIFLCMGDSGAEFAVETWRSDSGLPNQTVTSIAQTADGYLWVGTMAGLARFDGVSFKVFDASNTPELGAAAISQIERRHTGGLWISTMDGRLIRMEGERFVTETAAGLDGDNPGAEILSEEADGTLWITVRDGRLARWKSGVLQVMNGEWARFPGNTLQARVTGRGEVIVNGGLRDGSGVNRLVDGLLKPLGSGFNPGWGFHAPCRDGALWVSDGRVVRAWKDGKWVSPGALVEWQGGLLSFGIETQDGSLWLSTRGVGVLRYGRDGSVERIGRKNGMGGEIVTRLFEDAAGSVWVATDGGGLSRIRPRLFTAVPTISVAPAARITAISPAADGDGIWAGTDGDGLLRLRVDGSAKAEPVTKPVAGADICSIIEPDPGRILVGTLRDGWRISRNGTLDSIGRIPDADKPVRALFQDSRGRIWAGQRTTGGVNILAFPDAFGSDASETDRVVLTKSLVPTDVRCFAEDGSGSIWIGCDAGGIYRIGSGGDISHFTQRDGLAGDNVWSLQVLADGTVWIGHAGGGLTRWKNGTFSVCGSGQGFPEDVVCGMADGGDGALWIAGGKGIWRVRFDDLDRCCDGLCPVVPAVRFGPGDGLPRDGLAATQGGVLRTRDGRLWFATNHGVWYARPSSYQVDPVPPIVVIEGFSVDGKTREPEKYGGFQVDHLARYFEVDYSGLSLSHPSLVSFRHKLEGVDTDWRNADIARSASYSGLAPGYYVFRVQARNRDHVWSESGASISFVINPPWWRRPWFLVAAVFASTGFAVIITRFIVSRRAFRNAEEWRRRHALEAERGRIARDIHDQLGAGLTEIALLGDFLVSRVGCPPEAAEISTRARELARSMDETVWAVNPSKDTVEGLVSYLAHSMGVWLKYSGIRHRLDLPGAPNLRPLVAESRNHLYLACKEAVHNAVKHSGATEIRLTLRADLDRLDIEITDDGCGLAPSGVRAGGNGLENIRFRLAKAGGFARISGLPGGGTIVFLSIPFLPQTST